jgi:multiple sugar transport system permease protein
VDAAHHADRAGGTGEPAARAVRSRASGRASTVKAFWHITLPLLRPTLVVAILFRSIDALKTFDIIFIMTQGGPANASETINILLFNQAFSYFNMGYASSMAVALFAVVMGVSLILIKMRRTAAW